MDFLTPATYPNGANLKIRMLLGRSYLRENRPDKAVEVYLGIQRDYPEDADVPLVLGNLYLLAGLPAAALTLYQRALLGRPNHPLVLRQAAQAQSALEGQAESTLPAPDPLAFDSIERLLEWLRTCAQPEQIAGIRAAAEVVEKIAAETRGMDGTGRANDEVQQLMPALIDMNIRQARAAGQAELAEALQSLQINLRRQTGNLREP